MIWAVASQSVKRGTKSGGCDRFAIRDAFLAHRVVCVAPVMDALEVGCISVWCAWFNLREKIQFWMGCIVWLKKELWIVAVNCGGPYKSASLAWKCVSRMPWKTSDVVLFSGAAICWWLFGAKTFHICCGWCSAKLYLVLMAGMSLCCKIVCTNVVWPCKFYSKGIFGEHECGLRCLFLCSGSNFAHSAGGCQFEEQAAYWVQSSQLQLPGTISCYIGDWCSMIGTVLSALKNSYRLPHWQAHSMLILRHVMWIGKSNIRCSWDWSCVSLCLESAFYL